MLRLDNTLNPFFRPDCDQPKRFILALAALSILKSLFTQLDTETQQKQGGHVLSFQTRRRGSSDFLGSEYLVWKLMDSNRLSFLEALEYTFHTLAYARAKNNKLITIAHHSVCHFRSSDCIYAVFDGNYGIVSFV
jgi:hypothetical protein